MGCLVHLFPAAFSALVGVIFSFRFFVRGEWEALPEGFGSLPFLGLVVIATALSVSSERGAGRFTRACAVFVACVVFHSAITLGVLYACWIGFGLVCGIPSSP